MIGRGDDDGIDVLARDHLAKVFVSGAALVVGLAFDAVKLLGHFPMMLAPGRIDVAGSHHLSIGMVEEIIQQASALCAGADKTKSDSVIGSFRGVGPPGRGKEERRGGRGD